MSEKIDYFAMVKEAWALSDAAREYVNEANEAGREVGIQEIVDNIFLPSGQMDIPKCKQHHDNPPKVYLKNPYGLQYRPEHNDWIPFCHADIHLSQLEKC